MKKLEPELSAEDQALIDKADKLERLLHTFPEHPDAALIRAELARFDGMLKAAGLTRNRKH